MMFSVLLSVYKNEKAEYLNKALLSIWDDQTIKPSEIVIVEDGPLNTALYKVLDDWSIKIPDVLKRVALRQNVGLGKALNIGLTHCSYEWVFRMDTDDICNPNRFEKQVKFIKAHPDIALLSSQIYEFDGSPENITGIKAVPLTHNEIVKSSKTRNPFNHMAVAYKKSVIESVGGYQHHMYMEDYNLWLRVLSAGFKSANLKDRLVLVRAGDEMVRRRRGKVYIQSEIELFKLKRHLNYQPAPQAFLTFLARSAPRVLPANILTKIYSRLRAN